MKLVGLMPVGAAGIANMSQFKSSLLKLYAMSDFTVIIADAVHVPISIQTDRLEICEIQNDGFPWNDYTNRLTLLARATAHGATHVLWLDSDELLHNTSRQIIDTQIEAMESIQHVGISYAVREMWNEKQYRSDGIWGMKRRLVIQRNPFLTMAVNWTPQHLNRFHAFPLQCGDVMKSDYQLLHYGMSTPELRKARYEKWKTLDPTNQFQAIGYDYMMSDEGMVLTDL